MASLRVWIGTSSMDVGFRLVVQLASTVFIARILDAEEFGISALVLSIVTIFGSLLSMPFEEALSQQKRLSKLHLQAALFVSVLLTAGAFLLSLALGPMIAHWTSIPSLATLIPFATIFLFGQGPGAVARAMMRRQRKFVRLAAIQSGSMAFACLLAVAAALSGWGTVALIFQRMMPFIAYPVISVVTALGRGRNAVLIPRWNKTCFDELSRVSWYQLLRIGFEYMTPAAMSLLVNGLFGTAILGQLNIAMRLTEPLRSGIASIGHNIVVTQLKQAEVRGENIANSTAKIVTNMAAVFVPAFFGIAVCAPVLLPLLVGPGWDESIPIAKTLCLAAAISVPFRYLYSGFLVSGRPEYGVICAGLSFLAMMLAIPMIWWAGDASDIGLAQVLAEATVMVTGGLLLLRFGKLSDLQPLLSVVKIWAAAALMYILAGYPYFNFEFAMPKFWGLMMIAVNGAIIYTLLLYIFCRDCFNNLYILVYRRDS